MYEIRIHGRGGQGSVLASKILAKALVTEGKSAKAIPAFGFERRGAPVTAFVRFDDKKLRLVTNIYNPNCIICLDPTLRQSVDVFAGIRDDCVWIQTTKKDIGDINIPERVNQVALCNAVGIALDLFGRIITNTIMLGAFVRATGIVSIESLTTALGSVAFRDAALDQNIEAVKRAYDQTKVYHMAENKE